MAVDSRMEVYFFTYQYLSLWYLPLFFIQTIAKIAVAFPRADDASAARCAIGLQVIVCCRCDYCYRYIRVHASDRLMVAFWVLKQFGLLGKYQLFDRVVSTPFPCSEVLC